MHACVGCRMHGSIGQNNQEAWEAHQSHQESDGSKLNWQIWKKNREILFFWKKLEGFAPLQVGFIEEKLNREPRDSSSVDKRLDLTIEWLSRFQTIEMHVCVEHLIWNRIIEPLFLRQYQLVRVKVEFEPTLIIINHDGVQVLNLMVRLSIWISLWKPNWRSSLLVATQAYLCFRCWKKLILHNSYVCLNHKLHLLVHRQQPIKSTIA